MSHTHSARSLLVGVAAILFISFASPYLGTKRFVGELWSYYDDTSQQHYVLLGKVSSKEGGIFGPTQRIKPADISDHVVRLSCGRHYDLFLKPVSSWDKPEDKDYCWVPMPDLMSKAVQAHKDEALRDVQLASYDGDSIIVEDKILEALAAEQDV